MVMLARIFSTRRYFVCYQRRNINTNSKLSIGNFTVKNFFRMCLEREEKRKGKDESRRERKKPGGEV